MPHESTLAAVTRGRSAREVWSDWKAADDAADAIRAGQLAEEMLAVAGDKFLAWFEAGLYSKARRNWQDSVERNRRALELFEPRDAKDFDGVNPAAWNLGIAATAVSDWATARRAWSAYGLDGLAPGPEPIDVDYGLAPIRLNPDRPSLPHEVPFNIGEAEVVWCWRRSPAHAVIASVPLPESGHRFRDVILHDGEPKGTRRHGDREVSVFDEIERLQESAIPTWQVLLSGVVKGDLERLTDLLGPQGLGVDEWSGMRILCSECSHGSPDEAHSHEPLREDQTRLGLAGPEGDLQNSINTWLTERPHITLLDLTLLW